MYPSPRASRNSTSTRSTIANYSTYSGLIHPIARLHAPLPEGRAVLSSSTRADHLKSRVFPAQAELFMIVVTVHVHHDTNLPLTMVQTGEKGELKPRWGSMPLNFPIHHTPHPRCVRQQPVSCLHATANDAPARATTWKERCQRDGDSESAHVPASFPGMSTPATACVWLAYCMRAVCALPLGGYPTEWCDGRGCLLHLGDGMGWDGGLGDWAWFEGVNGLPGGGFLISCRDAVLAR